MSARPIELDDIEGPNLIPMEYQDETGSVTKVDLEWNVPLPEGGISKFLSDHHEVTVKRRMTLERAQEWLDILSAQLERAHEAQHRLEGQARAVALRERAKAI